MFSVFMMFNEIIGLLRIKMVWEDYDVYRAVRTHNHHLIVRYALPQCWLADGQQNETLVKRNVISWISLRRGCLVHCSCKVFLLIDNSTSKPLGVSVCALAGIIVPLIRVLSRSLIISILW